MTKREKKERELTGGEIAVIIAIMLIALYVLGNATAGWRVLVSLAILIGDLILMYKAKFSLKKGG